MTVTRSLVGLLFAFVSFAFVSSVGFTAVRAEEPFKQVKLSDDLIKNFIAAQKDLAALAQKNPPPETDKPDPKIQAELETIAKKHGFASFAEFDDVAFNISFVMGGIDPQSGAFTDQISQIKKEIEDVKADKSVPADQKKQMLDDLAEALKNTPPLQFPENVEIVKKHRADIAKVLQ
ncbi:MAG: hypothetical protein ABL907_00380 [Hyphomicrobium sp.]